MGCEVCCLLGPNEAMPDTPYAGFLFPSPIRYGFEPAADCEGGGPCPNRA